MLLQNIVINKHEVPSLWLDAGSHHLISADYNFAWIGNNSVSLLTSTWSLTLWNFHCKLCVAIAPFSVIKIHKVLNRVKQLLTLTGHQDISIKFLALECWFYALALSLSVSNWLFWLTRRPIERLWTWKAGQDGPKTASRSGCRFSTAGGFPCGHGRRDISLGNLKHQNTDGEISQSYICQISPNSVSAPAGCLDTTYLMHHLSHFFFPSVNIQLLGMFGDNWQLC